MFGTKIRHSVRTLIYSMSCLIIVAVALWFGASYNSTNAGSRTSEGAGATFVGANTGEIPDSTGLAQTPGAPRNVTFNVSGISGNPTNVSVDMSITHTWLGDVNVTLMSPSGTTFTIFGYTRAVTAVSFGDGSTLDGVYNFTDSSPTNWWETAATTVLGEPMPSGNYRTTEKGGPGQVDPAPVTNLSAAFAGESSPNGTWVLSFTDGAAGDLGSVSAANLTITSGGGTGNGNSNPPADFDGDGKTDYTIARDVTPARLNYERNTFSTRSIEFLKDNPHYNPSRSTTNGNPVPENHGTNLGWYIAFSSDNSNRVQSFGQPDDQIVPADFDGDEKDDLGVWRGIDAATGFFYTFTSSDSTVNEIPFGIAGDNPRVTGDYDGDGSADPAVFRCPTAPGGQCFFYFLGSNNNPNNDITYVPWGNNSTEQIYPYPGDFDGDGSFDFVIYRTDPASSANSQYVLLRSSDLGVEYINWGIPSDILLLTGDYDGDGKSDFMNLRLENNGTQIVWYLLERDGGTSVTPFGGLNPGFTTFPAQGDYDGDGAVDLAIWQGDEADADNCYFYVLRSSDGTVGTYEFGQPGDAPVSSWQYN